MLKKIKKALSRDPVVRKAKLTGEEMIKGLTQLSKTIGQLNPSRLTEHNPITIVAAGGAISRRVRALPDAWINAEMRAFVHTHAGCATLFADPVAQGLALFKAPALVVYVADWRYQLVGKIARAYQTMQMMRMEDGGAWPASQTQMQTSESGDGGEDGAMAGPSYALRVSERNLQDVVYILKLMLDERQGRPLLLSEMKMWDAYGPALEIEEIENANRAYSIVFMDGDTEYEAIIDDA
ncbi:hypothetical protein BJ912DRAFT_1145567 [Pholiota molesta]|nr:hypothetical protein BJ912DRAFT_1145567 [Pholiota molesta]